MLNNCHQRDRLGNDTVWKILGAKNRVSDRTLKEQTTLIAISLIFARFTFEIFYHKIAPIENKILAIIDAQER